MTEYNKPLILYDGDCEICRRGAARFYCVLRRRGFGFAPLQSPWVSERLGMKEREPLLEMILLMPDGSRYGGADAMAQVARRIWWGWPFFLIHKLPVGGALTRWAYRALARNRNCIGGACRIEGKRPAKAPDHDVCSGFYDMP